MRSEEFIATISQMAEDTEKFEEVRKGIPLGMDVVGNVMLAQKRATPLTTRHTCVTGIKRVSFIRRLVITLSCLFEKDEAAFFIISPKTEYGELLRLQNIDATVPYVRSKEDLEAAKTTLKELIQMRMHGKGYPRLFVVLDSLEELEGCNTNEDFEEYRELFDIVARKTDVDVITGLDMLKSIFKGYPGAFVGIGNCLVSTREEGKADVTYVNDDASLSMPTVLNFPDSPSITETIIFLNALPPNKSEE
jgi:hypothetical protein